MSAHHRKGSCEMAAGKKYEASEKEPVAATEHEYEAIVDFESRDTKRSPYKHYKIGDLYDGPHIRRYLDYRNPGPLIREITTPEPPRDDSPKEK